MKTPAQKMEHGLSGLILEAPFFGVLAMGLPFKVDPTCKTAWTDARNIGYNPAFIETLNHDEVVALIAHEVEHVALGHPWRRDGRAFKPWNKACDMAINPDIREAGFKLPKGALYAEGDAIGKSAEWIFAHEPEPEDGQGQGKSNAPGNNPVSGQGQPEPGDGEPGEGEGEPDPLGEVRDAPTDLGENGEPVPSQQKWKQRVAAAVQAAKMQDKMPGGMERNVGEALRPKIDTRALLLRFFTDRAAADYTWTRPNVRYVYSGIYLPALESKSLGRVAIMNDTSGSIDNEALQLARGIVQSVIDECQPAGIDVFHADAEVKNIERYEKGDVLTWKPQGGGGTNFIPALEAIEAEGEATAIVCITDCDGTFPEAPPSIPIIWLCTSSLVAPFGETVPVEF